MDQNNCFPCDSFTIKAEPGDVIPNMTITTIQTVTTTAPDGTVTKQRAHTTIKITADEAPEVIQHE